MQMTINDRGLEYLKINLWNISSCNIQVVLELPSINFVFIESWANDFVNNVLFKRWSLSFLGF